MHYVRFLSILFIASILIQVNAQVYLKSGSVDFQDVNTDASTLGDVKIGNDGTTAITVTDIVFFDSAFSTPTPTFTLSSGEEKNIYFKFSPTQNIVYNSEAVLLLSNGNQVNVDLIGNGRLNDPYYSSTFNKSYQDLKDELKSIISAGYTNLGYSGARDRMYGSIDNVNGKVTCAYTGREATFNTRSGANSNSFNCEHTWPQSLFSSNEPERADIHHLFPTDVSANSRRGNLPFGEVSSAMWTEGGSKLGGGKFEPRDAQKGATARAMMYFAIRYADYSNFIDGQEAVLREWHWNHPPTAADRDRNDAIFSFQKNRNPFIDHPEFLERIGKIGAEDTKPVLVDLAAPLSKIDYGTVSPVTERTVYFINTGNTAITDITQVSSENGHFKVVDHDDEVEAGEALQVTIKFTDQAVGNYSDELRLTYGGQNGQEVITSLSFDLEATNVSHLQEKKIAAYYNASSNLLTLKDVPEDAESIEIYSLSGQQILLDEISSSFTDIPFYGHPDGIYFVVINARSGVYTSRFLVH